MNYVAIRLEDDFEEEIIYLEDFATTWGLKVKKITQAIKRQSEYKGWRFFIK